VFQTRGQWQDYAVNALQTVERLADELGIGNKLHLWPDKSLGNLSSASRMTNAQAHLGLAFKNGGGESVNGQHNRDQVKLSSEFCSKGEFRRSAQKSPFPVNSHAFGDFAYRFMRLRQESFSRSSMVA